MIKANHKEIFFSIVEDYPEELGKDRFEQILCAFKAIPLCKDYSEEEVFELYNEMIGREAQIIDLADGKKYSLKEVAPESSNELFTNYLNYLAKQQSYSPESVKKIKKDTIKIFSKMNVDDKVDSFLIKGLCVGDIQSGKTSNFIALMSLAYDLGFSRVIVLSGMLNDLRKQTAIRINAGTRNYDENVTDDDYDCLLLQSTSGKIVFQNSEDRDVAVADFRQYMRGENEKNYFVVKKNTRNLKNLLEYYDNIDKKTRNTNNNLMDKKTLIIDDEADQASLDSASTKADDVSTINGQICDLMKHFKRCAYVGYTATPFGNVLLDPNIKHNGINLFPNEFVCVLNSGTGYNGFSSFLENYDNIDNKILFSIENDDDQIFQKIFNKNNEQDGLDESIDSLMKALKQYIISAALLIRKEKNENIKRIPEKAMLVNVSSKTDYHQVMKKIIEKYCNSLKSLSQKEFYNTMYNCFCHDFQYQGDKKIFDDLIFDLTKILNAIKIYVINSSKESKIAESEEKALLDECGEVFIIRIGGFKLSRGLTINGLLVSYFYRSSNLYDALMQMCRWFGYRNDYLEFIKLFTTKKIMQKFTDVFQAFEEFKSDIIENDGFSLSSEDIKYRIRYIDRMMPTNKRKMKNAEVEQNPNRLFGRVQISEYYSDRAIAHHNAKIIKDFIETHNSNKYQCKYFTDYGDVKIDDVFKMISELKLTHNSAKQVEYLKRNILSKPVLEYKKWKIVISNILKSDYEPIIIDNVSYNISTKRIHNILNDNGAEYYKVKAVLNSTIEHFEDVERLLKNNPNAKMPSFTKMSSVKRKIEDGPVLFISNVCFKNDNYDTNPNDTGNTIAFFIPVPNAEMVDKYKWKSYWTSNDLENYQE